PTMGRYPAIPAKPTAHKTIVSPTKKRRNPGPSGIRTPSIAPKYRQRCPLNSCVLWTRVSSRSITRTTPSAGAPRPKDVSDLCCSRILCKFSIVLLTSFLYVTGRIRSSLARPDRPQDRQDDPLALCHLGLAAQAGVLQAVPRPPRAYPPGDHEPLVNL